MHIREMLRISSKNPVTIQNAPSTKYKPTKNQHPQGDISSYIGLTSQPGHSVDTLAQRKTDDQFHEFLTRLNQKQTEFFTHIMQSIFCSDDQIYAFLTGGAGFGKSVLIDKLYQALHRHLTCLEGDNPEEQKYYFVPLQERQLTP